MKRKLASQVFGISFLLSIFWCTCFHFYEAEKHSITQQSSLDMDKLRELDLVVGIPSIKRPRGAFYLGDCIQSLLNMRSEFDRMMIVVFLADENILWVKETTEYLRNTFTKDIHDDLIRIIYPTKNMYSTLEEHMVPGFGDPPDHVKWRTKENLDMAYLMQVAYHLKAKYFLAIEDDVTAVAENFAARIVLHASNYWRNNTIFASYSRYASIGKVFKRDKLQKVATYLKLFAGYKPLDWLYYDLTRIVTCGYPQTNCDMLSKQVVINHREDMFQHAGKISSNDRKNH